MHHTEQAINSWLRISHPKPQASLRLFCLPYAGGAASLYRAWHQLVPTDIEVCAVQLPGRENRIREQPFTDVGELVQALIPNLLPHLDRPFAFFGHSMGSLIVYELAQQLRQQMGQSPTHLFVSGRRAPFLPASEASLHTLPTDEAFLTELQRRYNNIPAVMFEDADLRNLFVPLLRADFTLVERYQCRIITPLPCPIVAFGGESDSRTSGADLMAWQELTQDAFNLHLLPGGHFYLNEHTQALIAYINRYLSQDSLPKPLASS
ncbi:MAG TPA: alpha/beta fold hydrolase [Caldilineaceae bacterium]|nr:alpha/beta fold hydrolase [Caldilineaceae bacterium]